MFHGQGHAASLFLIDISYIHGIRRIIPSNGIIQITVESSDASFCFIVNFEVVPGTPDVPCFRFQIFITIRAVISPRTYIFMFII